MPMRSSPKRLYVPAVATAARTGLERRLSPRYVSQGETFVLGVRMDALSALRAPAVLAASRPQDDRFGYGDARYDVGPFVLGGTMDRWRVLSDEVQRLLVQAIGTTRLENPAAGPFLQLMMGRLTANPLPSEVHLAIQQVLMHALNANWNRLQIQDGLKALLDEGAQVAGVAGVNWRSNIERVARTQSTAAYNFNTVLDLPESGFRYKRWVSRKDGRTRPSHVVADGQVVPVDDPFIVGGAALMVPGDPRGPGDEVDNCRCVVVGAYDAAGGAWTPS